MADYCKPFSRTIHASVAADGTATLADVKPDPGYIFHYVRASVEDDTTANASFRLGTEQNGLFTPTGEVKTLAKSTLSTFALSDLQLDGANGDAFQARVTGGASGDDVRLYVNGYVQKKDA